MHEVLEWLLIRSWESDGCVALWNHAERGGMPLQKIQMGFHRYEKDRTE
jgi:hypothetical protein